MPKSDNVKSHNQIDVFMLRALRSSVTTVRHIAQPSL